jgi:biopolymer transport protein ExbD
VFASYMTAHEGEPISVQGDTRATWGRMIDVFNELRKLGHTDVNLLLEPLPGTSRRGR